MIMVFYDDTKVDASIGIVELTSNVADEANVLRSFLIPMIELLSHRRFVCTRNSNHFGRSDVLMPDPLVLLSFNRREGFVDDSTYS